MSGTEFMASSGGRVALTGDVTLTSKIKIEKDFILDLNGHVLKASSGFVDDCLVEIGNNSSNYDISIISEHTGNVSNSVTLVTGTTLSGINGAIISGSGRTRGIIIRQPAGCTISNCKIMGCYTSGSGGGINVYTYGKLTMNNVEVSYNYAENSGGGLQGRRLSLTNCNISYNMTGAGSAAADAYKCRGGGLYIEDSEMKCTLEGCTISHNYAPREGGGLFCKSDIDINNSTIEYNYAMKSQTSSDQNGYGRGGGFYFTGSKTLTLNSTAVRYNAAMFFGGGGQVQTGATLTMNGTASISYNTAVLRGGGGLHLTSGATLNLNSGSISNNTANGWGGAIHSSRDCSLNLNGGAMSHNTVNGRGGAINLSAGSELTLNGTDVTYNTANQGYNYVYSTVTQNFINGTCTWTNPTYPDSTPIVGYGGGIAVDAGTCTIQNSSSVSNNTSASDGGGIALIMKDYRNALDNSIITGSTAPTLVMTNGEISGNRSGGNGGGVYIMVNNESEIAGEPSATINGGVITGNSAKTNGGGIYLDTGSRFTMADGVTMSGNKAGNGGTGSGGAVYVSQGTATINGGSITSNTASVNGGAIYVNGNVIITKGNLSNNSSQNNGGAIYVQTGTVTMNSLTMNNNIATSNGGGLYLDNGSLSIGNSASNIIQNNKSANGAGVCIANGTLAIQQCRIINNTATQVGGGVYVADIDAVTINLTGGGVFENNTANTGGGLAVGGAITLNFEGSLQNNTASNGGGIYLFKGSASTGPTLNFKGGFIRNNFANGNSGTTGYKKAAADIAGFGGGIFLDQGSTFKTTLSTGSIFGFYGNKANKGGDDIFANGNGTTVNLPAIGGMSLSDFDVPTPELYWVEDYTTGDTQYSLGTNIITTPGYTAVRYQAALEANSPNIGKLVAARYDSYKNKYLCLALGYELFYVTLQKNGLEAGDVALFDITYQDGGNRISYRKVKFIGKGKDVPVNLVVALPPNTWTFTEDDTWSWKYDIPAPLTKEITTQAHIEAPIVFTNVLKSVSTGVNTTIHFETHKENRMRL